MASLLARAGSFLLKTAGPFLLGKATKWIGDKVVPWIANKIGGTKVPFLGKTVSDWVGKETFDKQMHKHGVRLGEKLSDKLIKVPYGANIGEALQKGLKQGFAKMNGTASDGGGNTDAQMTDESAPVQKTETPTADIGAAVATLQDPANAIKGMGTSLYS